MRDYQFIDDLTAFIKKNDTLIKGAGLDKKAGLPSNFINKLKAGQANSWTLNDKHIVELKKVLKDLNKDLTALFK